MSNANLKKGDLSRLTDLVRGRLMPEESIALIDQIERDPQLSQDLEMVLALQKMTKEDWEAVRRSHSRR